MAGLKRKDAPRSSKPRGDNAAKKLKVESKPLKKSSKPSGESDDLEGSETTDNDDFGGFSEGNNAGSSGTEDTDTDGGSTKIPKVKPANGATGTTKPDATTNGASNCMQIVCPLLSTSLLANFSHSNFI